MSNPKRHKGGLNKIGSVSGGTLPIFTNSATNITKNSNINDKNVPHGTKD